MDGTVKLIKQRLQGCLGATNYELLETFDRIFLTFRDTRDDALGCRISCVGNVHLDIAEPCMVLDVEARYLYGIHDLSSHPTATLTMVLRVPSVATAWRQERGRSPVTVRWSHR